MEKVQARNTNDARRLAPGALSCSLLAPVILNTGTGGLEGATPSIPTLRQPPKQTSSGFTGLRGTCTLVQRQSLMLTELASNQRHANSQAPTYNVWGKGNRTSRTISIHDRQDDSNINISQLLLTQPSKWWQQPESSAEGSLPKQSNVWEASGFTQEAMYCTDMRTQKQWTGQLLHSHYKEQIQKCKAAQPRITEMGAGSCLKFEVSLGYKVRPCPKQKKDLY